MKQRHLAAALVLGAGLLLQQALPADAELLLPEGGGPGLAEAVASALAHDRGVAAADLRLTAAEAEADGAYAGYLPRLDLQLSSGYGWIELREDTAFSEGSYWSNQAVLQLRQRLWDGGSTSGRLEAAEAGIEIATAETALAAEALAFETVEAYLDTVAADAFVRQSGQNLEAHRQILNLVGQQEQAGTITPADRVQVEGRVALAEATLAQARGRLAVAVARLQSLTGLAFSPEAARGEVSPGLALPALPLARLPATPAAAFARALAGQPELAVATADTRRRGAEIKAAEAANWPTVDLVLLGRAATGLPGFDGPLVEGVGIVQLRWRLFDGLGTEAEVRRLSALRAAGGYELEDRQRLAAERIARAFARLDGLAGRLSALEAALAAQEQTVALYRQQFAVGERSLLELLDSRRELDRLRRVALSALVERARSVYALAREMGELRAWTLGSGGSVALPPDQAALPLEAAPGGNAVSLPLLLASAGASDSVPAFESARLEPPPVVPGPPVVEPPSDPREGASTRGGPVAPTIAVPQPPAGKHGSGPGLDILLQQLAGPVPGAAFAPDDRSE